MNLHQKPTRDDYNKRMIEMYNEIKEDILEYQIDLSSIEMEDFIYKKDIKDGITMYEGTLYFKDKAGSYEAEALSIVIGDQVYLVVIEDIEKR